MPVSYSNLLVVNYLSATAEANKKARCKRACLILVLEGRRFRTGAR